MKAWVASDGRRRTFAVAAAAVLIVSVAYALVLRNVYFGDRAVTALDDIGEAVAAGVAAAACAWAARRAGGRERVGWTLMSISAGLWAAGEVVWSIYEVGLNVATPYPSLADVGFLAAVPFAIGGIRAFWSAPRGTSSRWRVWFDGVIVAIRRATHQQAGRMALLLAGVASYSIADSAFAYLTAQSAYGAVGNVLDTGWFAGYLMIALAAIYPPAPARVEAKQAPLDLWQLALPWMTLLTASAGDVYSALSGHELDLFMSSLTAILAVLLTVNMIMERKEFLEMLTDIETAHSTLKKEFRVALDGIQHLSRQIKDAERVDVEEARRLAADIHRQAERLDRLVEGILEEDEGEGVTAAAPASAGV